MEAAGKCSGAEGSPNSDGKRSEPSTKIPLLLPDVDLTLLTKCDVESAILEALRGETQLTLFHVNARLISLIRRSELWIRDFLLEPTVETFCDGAIVQWYARLTGQPVPEKLAFNTWGWDLFAWCERNGLSIYLLGAHPDVNAEASKVVRTRFPSLDIVGRHDGYFDLFGAEAELVVDAINRASPDILIVALGMPLQERWIRRFRDRLRTLVVIPCGGGLDYVAARNRIAPEAVSRWGLEWIYRALSDPKRLLKRNLVDVPHAAWILWRQRKPIDQRKLRLESSNVL